MKPVICYKTAHVNTTYDFFTSRFYSEMQHKKNLDPRTSRQDCAESHFMITYTECFKLTLGYNDLSLSCVSNNSVCNFYSIYHIDLADSINDSYEVFRWSGADEFAVKTITEETDDARNTNIGLNSVEGCITGWNATASQQNKQPCLWFSQHPNYRIPTWIQTTQLMYVYSVICIH